jgi:hypothetical protein
MFSLQMSNMHKAQKTEEEEGGGGKMPHLECARIKHQGCVNGIHLSIWRSVCQNL